jgi:serine/threonine protein kinase
MGIILYKMMTGDPFPIRFTDTPKGSSLIAVQTQLEIFKNNPAMLDAKARAEALNIEKISDKKMADLLVKIFHPDPAKRPTASEALAELKAMAGPTPLNEDEQGKFLIELSQWPTDDSKK